MRIGYACINLTLAEEGIRVNRSMMKRTFQTKGIDQSSVLALENVRDLERITEWNIRNRLLLYRMSSDMFPWMSEYELSDLPDYAEIAGILKRVGEKAATHNLRLTYHPGPFNVLATPNESMLRKTLKELRQHGEIMNLIGLPQTPFAKINIHIGGAYGDKQAAIARFISHFHELPKHTQKRITIENDDKPNMYAVSDLTSIHAATGIPIVFDYLHHQFCNGGLSEKDAMLLAYSTWPKDIIPVVHYSSSKKYFEDPAAIATAHADHVYQQVDTFGKEVDIVLEAKAKEKAIQQYVAEYGEAVFTP